MIAAFGSALFFSVLIESIALLAITKWIVKDSSRSPMRVIEAEVVATGATLPYLWFVFPALAGWGYHILWGELAIVVAEAEILRIALKLPRRVLFFASFACNAASYAASPLVARLLIEAGVTPY